VRSQADFDRAAKIICEVSGQRLRMRNEQFGFPLNSRELGEIERRARQAIAGQ
jgi:hypothetical protein